MNQGLQRLSDRYWDRLMAAAPMWASIIGDHRFDGEVEDLSADAEAALAAEFHSVVRDAEAIDPAALDRDDRITRRVLMFEAASQAGSLDSRVTEYLVDPMLGIQADLVQTVPQLRATNSEQAEAFVAKAAKTGRVFDQALERHRQGVSNGRTPPRCRSRRRWASSTRICSRPSSRTPSCRSVPPTDGARSSSLGGATP